VVNLFAIQFIFALITQTVSIINIELKNFKQLQRMNTLKAYKIISYILLPFAGILGMLALFALLAGLMNILFLLQGLIISFIVIYIILSFIFLIKGIMQNKSCNPSMRKWIRTTGIITTLLALNMLFDSFYLLFKPFALSNAIAQMQLSQKDMPAIDSHVVTSLMNGILYVMIFFATTLIIHYIETAKFLKIYSSVFDKNQKQ
jgi:hypothetical protein